jgi:hypothetical protein
LYEKECSGCTKFHNMDMQCEPSNVPVCFSLAFIYQQKKRVSSFHQTRFKYVNRPNPATRAAPAATPLYAEAHASEYA